MADASQLSEVAAEFRRHFDQYYLGVIPRLLNEDGRFLAFVAMLTAIESLAGVYLPDEPTGDRFRAFVATYFPKSYEPHTEQLWQFRNRMIHAFNPTPFLILCGESRMHLGEASGVWMLNAEDLYADVVGAARSYFTALTDTRIFSPLVYRPKSVRTAPKCWDLEFQRAFAQDYAFT